ncbi:Arm DNA-binding domain-containing protein [Novosphingobium sp. M1R2S20]|uniref:Arm DNA-binding domain-containing protein n=1 Tax=Novosphingobium rhizovicinum TaxID=3228928 RepID=A0ABV3REY0_9SPHN
MLNDAKIQAAKPGLKTYKLADAHQLYLYVSPQGSKLWRMKFKFDGKEKTLRWGSIPSSVLSLPARFCPPDDAPRASARRADRRASGCRRTFCG